MLYYYKKIVFFDIFRIQVARKPRQIIRIDSVLLLRSSHELYSRNLQRNRGCYSLCTNGEANNSQVLHWSTLQDRLLIYAKVPE